MAILTISREYGSGGREIGRKIAEITGYEYVDKEKILSDIRAAGHKWEEWARDLDEHYPSIWEKYDWSFRGFGALVQSVIFEHALRGRAVIMGRGGNFVLAGIPHALRIRVIAPPEARVERIMRRETVDRETALWLSERTDHERSGFIFALYGKHWDDPAEYDMTRNTGVETVDEIVGDILGLLDERDRLDTPEAGELLRMQAAAARIKAGLVTAPSFCIPTLDVRYSGKEIVLRGVIHNPKEHRRVEEAARKLAGDLPIKCELHYRG